MYIAWKEDYRVGVPAIDDQHYQLIDMLNELYESIGSNMPNDGIWKLLAGFNRYADTHFGTEERLAREAGIDPGIVALHHLEHESYRERLNALRLAFEKDDRSAPVQLMAYLSRWWLTHILVDDMELGRMIREAGASRRD